MSPANVLINLEVTETFLLFPPSLSALSTRHQDHLRISASCKLEFCSALFSIPPPHGRAERWHGHAACAAWTAQAKLLEIQSRRCRLFKARLDEWWMFTEYYYVLLCITMYYYVLLCITMYYYVLLCITMYYSVHCKWLEMISPWECEDKYHQQGVRRPKNKENVILKVVNHLEKTNWNWLIWCDDVTDRDRWVKEASSKPLSHSHFLQDFGMNSARTLSLRAKQLRSPWASPLCFRTSAVQSHWDVLLMWSRREALLLRGTFATAAHFLKCKVHAVQRKTILRLPKWGCNANYPVGS